MTDIARLKVDGIDGVVEVNLDPASWRGDVLETLEEHLGGGVVSWGRQWQAGKRLSEFRVRELIALVYLGRATADPDTTWEATARAIAPFTIQFLEDELTPTPVPVYVDPDLGRRVSPQPGLAPALPSDWSTSGDHPLGVPSP